MIPDLQACVLCDDVRQERNGKFILIGIFDAIATPVFPFRHGRLVIVSRWCSGDGEFHQKSRILAPDQQTVVLEGKEIPIRLNSPESTATNVELFMNTLFPSEGAYWVEILLDGDLKLRFPLRLNGLNPAPSNTPDAPP
ncbi:MAG: hypothetical protein U1E27_06665 [Kiritimatiellia bacterium]|nr:hypothetical protein [Kiritimatiellia bacterium]